MSPRQDCLTTGQSIRAGMLCWACLFLQGAWGLTSASFSGENSMGNQPGGLAGHVLWAQQQQDLCISSIQWSSPGCAVSAQCPPGCAFGDSLTKAVSAGALSGSSHTTAHPLFLFSVWICLKSRNCWSKISWCCVLALWSRVLPQLCHLIVLHMLYLWQNFLKCTFLFLFHSEIQNVDVLYFFFCGLLLNGEKMNVKSVSVSTLWYFLWQRERRGCGILLYGNGKHSFSVTCYYWYCIYWSKCTEMVNSWYSLCTVWYFILSFIDPKK